MVCRPCYHAADRAPLELAVPADPDNSDLTGRPFEALSPWLVLALSLAVVAFGGLFALRVGLDPAAGAWRAYVPGVAIELFRLQDPPWLLAVAVGLGLVPLVGRIRALDGLRRLSGWGAVGLAVAGTAAIAGVGAYLVMHGHPLAMDEYLAVKQAKTLVGGSVLAPIDPAWSEWVVSLQPILMSVDRGHQVWGPHYRPMNGAWLALFQLVGLWPLTHAVTAAGSVLATAVVAGRALPRQPWAPVVGAVLLATSTQLLITAMTAYSMTPHLLLSLVWLLVWWRDDALGYLGACAVAFVAIGLHQVVVHPAMAAPFVVHLLLRRRWALFIGISAWYLASLGFWMVWRDLLVLGMPTTGEPALSESGHLVDMFIHLIANHGVSDLLSWTTNFYRLVSWQNAALLPLAVMGLLALRTAPLRVQLLAWSVLTSLLPYVLLMPGQGHGWGYRYLHSVLGHLVIIGLWGAVVWRQITGDRWPLWRRGLIALGAASTLAIPLRMVQAEAFIRPWAQASQWLAQVPHDALLLESRGVWFGVDLVRNDPFLRQGPVMVSAANLDDAALGRLCHAHELWVVPREHVLSFGIAEVPFVDDAGPVVARLERLGCAVQIVSAP